MSTLSRDILVKQNVLLSVSQIRNKEQAINCMLKEVNYLEIMSVTLNSSLVEYDKLTSGLAFCKFEDSSLI